MLTFMPPRPHPAAVAFGRLLITPALRWKYGVVGIDISHEDIGRLRALRHARALIAPNHPTSAEPGIMFDLSRRVDQAFYYVCCRGIFDNLGGLWGRVLQRCGGYSVVRGVADRESFRTTRELLCRPETKIVIFPEGEVYSQNDTLLPFHSGVTQLIFRSLEDLRKREPDGSIYIVPIAIKYKFMQDMTVPIRRAMERLESALALKDPPPADPYTRLRRIGSTVLAAIERDYGMTPGGEDDDLNSRIEAVKEALISRVASALCLKAPSGEQTLSQRMRLLINAVHGVTRDGAAVSSRYEARLQAVQREHAIPLLNDLDRLANLIAIHDGYVSALPTPGRMVDTVRRLETEVLGEARCTGPRRCQIQVAEPFDLAVYLPDYAGDRRAAVRAVTARMESLVQDLLDGMAKSSDQRDSVAVLD